MDTQTPPKDYVLYIPGGVLWGIHPLVVLKFLEDLTQLPLSKQFNMFSAASTGAIILSGLNTPQSKGSSEPRYSATDVLEFYKEIGPRIFPQRTAYYERQLVMDITKLAHEFVRDVTAMMFEKTDLLLAAGVNMCGRAIHRLMRSTRPYEPFDLHPMRFLHNATIRPVNNAVERGINYMLARSRYDINVLRQALDAAYRYEDTGERVGLNDTLISHHITAMNVTRNDPAIFFHYKDKDGKTASVSHPDTELDDLTSASCAAPTIFELHRARNGEYFSDIAHFDTPQTPISSLLGKPDRDGRDLKLVIIGTGDRDHDIDIQRLNSMLFLQQLIGRLGSHLLGLPQRFIMQRDLMSLRNNLGEDNVVVINKSVSKDTLRQQVQKNPNLIRAAGHFGIDLIERSQISHKDRTPDTNLFDSSPDNMKRMEDFGWDLVWENIDTLVPLAKELVGNAVAMGNVSEDRAAEIIRGIDKFYTVDGNAPDNDDDDGITAPIPAKPKRWIQFDDRAPQTFCASLKTLFNRIVRRQNYIPPEAPALPYIRDRDMPPPGGSGPRHDHPRPPGP